MEAMAVADLLRAGTKPLQDSARGDFRKTENAPAFRTTHDPLFRSGEHICLLAKISINVPAARLFAVRFVADT